MDQAIETKLRKFFPKEGELSDATQNTIFNNWVLQDHMWVNFEEMNLILDNEADLKRLLFNYTLSNFGKSFRFYIVSIRRVDDHLLSDSERSAYASKDQFKLSYTMKELKVAVDVPRHSIGNKN